MKRLSQILHLCFFCVDEETLELNWLIMDWGAGSALVPARPDGLGSVRELTDSMSELDP